MTNTNGFMGNTNGGMEGNCANDTQEQDTVGPILLRREKQDLPTRLGVLNGTKCEACGHDFDIYYRVRELGSEFDCFRSVGDKPTVFTIGVCNTMDCENAQASDIPYSGESDDEDVVQGTIDR